MIIRKIEKVNVNMFFLDTMYYVKACCRPEMEKHMKYSVDLCLAMDAEVQGSSCECPVGQSKEAHCKHVLIVLLAIREISL